MAVQNKSKLTSEQRYWFHGSFCIDHDGRPKTLFHSTSSDADFDQFLPMTHFGSLEAAERRAKDLGHHDYILFEVLLNIRKPLVIEDSGRTSTFMIPDAVSSLPEAFWEDLASDELDTLLEGEDEDAIPLFIEYVSDFGYDGIMYVNTVEGGISYCVFKPDQVWVIGADEPGIIPRETLVQSLR